MRRAVPAGVLGDPALHQLARRLARARRRPRQYRRASRSRAKRRAIPCPAAGGDQRGDGVADQLAGELDLAGGNRCAALGVARPALRDSELQIGGNPPDQGMAIERTGGERPQRVAPQAGSANPGASVPSGAPADRCSTLFAPRRRRHSTAPGVASPRRPGRRRSRKACRTGNPCGFVTRKAGRRKPPSGKERTVRLLSRCLTSRAQKKPSMPSYSAKWHGNVRRSPSRGDPFGRRRRSRRVDRARARPARRHRATLRCVRGPSSGSSEQVQ